MLAPRTQDVLADLWSLPLTKAAASLLALAGVSALAIAAGFTVPSADARVGHWTLDQNVLREQLTSKSSDESTAQFATEIVDHMGFVLHTRKDRSFVAITTLFDRTDRLTGSWTPTADGMVISADTRNGQPGVEVSVLTIIDANHVSMMEHGDERATPLIRAEFAPKRSDRSRASAD